MASADHKLVTKTVPRYEWVPDAERKNCVNKSCGSKFTTANRRHHCRFCGEIFCAKCLTKQRGHNCCAGCKTKTEGKVILVETKKERKAKAKEAVMDFRQKLEAERSKHVHTPLRGHAEPAKPSASASASASASSGAAAAAAAAPAAKRAPRSSPRQKKKTEPKSVALGAHSQAQAHTATFSTAPTPRSEPARSGRVTAPRESRSPPEDDPFATGGAADELHSDEDSDGDGDVAGDITNQLSHIAAVESSDDEGPPPEDDFAAMLAAAEQL